MLAQHGALALAGRIRLAREFVLHLRERDVHRERGQRQRVGPLGLPAGKLLAGHGRQHADEQAVVGAVVLEVVAGVVHQAQQRPVGVALRERQHVVAQRAQPRDPVGAAGIHQQQAQAHLQVGPVQWTLRGLGIGAGQGQRVVVGTGVGDAAQRHVPAQHLVELAVVGALHRLHLGDVDEDLARSQQFELLVGLDGRPAGEQDRAGTVAHRERKRTADAQAFGGQGDDLHGDGGVPGDCENLEYRPCAGRP